VRTASIVLAAYVLCVIVAAIWRLVPTSLLRDAVPDIGALTAAYVGLTARRELAPAVAAAVVLGYLVDLISGTPAGLTSLALGGTAVFAHGIRQRILVRGTAVTMAFSALVAVSTGINLILERTVARMPMGSVAVELRHIALVAIATALVGPLVWRLFRRIDAAFARTQRDRDAALEGLAQ
jgi:rod shape-determining protein MreD